METGLFEKLSEITVEVFARFCLLNLLNLLHYFAFSPHVISIFYLSCNKNLPCFVILVLCVTLLLCRWTVQTWMVTEVMYRMILTGVGMTLTLPTISWILQVRTAKRTFSSQKPCLNLQLELFYRIIRFVGYRCILIKFI